VLNVSVGPMNDEARLDVAAAAHDMRGENTNIRLTSCSWRCHSPGDGKLRRFSRRDGLDESRGLHEVNSTSLKGIDASLLTAVAAYADGMYGDSSSTDAICSRSK
jgi:hypothetical protein